MDATADVNRIVIPEGVSRGRSADSLRCVRENRYPLQPSHESLAIHSDISTPATLCPQILVD